jgi:predicted nucleic acid-binding protein
MRETGSRRVRLFLDAGVLVSAAWKEGSKVIRLWQMEGAELVTSNHVVAECRPNLPQGEPQERLSRLLSQLRVLEFERLPILENAPQDLDSKHQHVLAAAVLARAHFLVTGDIRHFGKWFGASLWGVRVEPPRSFPDGLKGGSE